MSRLDEKVAALLAAPDDEARSRALYATFAGTELCLLLAAEAEGDSISPKVFPLETGPVVLAFDSEERLTGCAGAAPYAALSGRALADLLVPQGLGLALNLGTQGEYVLAPDVLGWIAEQKVAAEPNAAQPVALGAPRGFPEALLAEVDARLAAAQGLAAQAVLAEAVYRDSATRPFIGFIGAEPGAEPALSTLVGEVLAMAGMDPAGCDIGFLPDTGPATDRLRDAGLVIDLPVPPTPRAPDPSKPPRLR